MGSAWKDNRSLRGCHPQALTPRILTVTLGISTSTLQTGSVSHQQTPHAVCPRHDSASGHGHSGQPRVPADRKYLHKADLRMTHLEASILQWGPGTRGSLNVVFILRILQTTLIIQFVSAERVLQYLLQCALLWTVPVVQVDMGQTHAQLSARQFTVWPEFHSLPSPSQLQSHDLMKE